jgi:hypothetical protein
LTGLGADAQIEVSADVRWVRERSATTAAAETGRRPPAIIAVDEHRAMRVWQYRGGRRVRAALLREVSNSVVLRREDGVEIMVAKSDLSDQDQEYVRAAKDRSPEADQATSDAPLTPSSSPLPPLPFPLPRPRPRPPDDPGNSLLLCYTFDDARAGPNGIADTSGHGRHAAGSPDLKVEPGISGNALLCNWPDAADRVSNAKLDPSPLPDLLSFTMAVWVKPFDALPDAPLLEFSSNDINHGPFLWLNPGGSVTAHFWGSRQDLRSGPPSEPGLTLRTPVGLLSLGQWTHLACTYDDGLTATVFVDGRQVAQASSAETIRHLLATSHPFRMGARNWFMEAHRPDGSVCRKWEKHAYFHGLLDGVRVYDRALSPEEIGQLCRMVPARPDATDGDAPSWSGKLGPLMANVEQGIGYVTADAKPKRLFSHDAQCRLYERSTSDEKRMDGSWRRLNALFEQLGFTTIFLLCLAFFAVALLIDSYLLLLGARLAGIEKCTLLRALVIKGLDLVVIPFLAIIASRVIGSALGGVGSFAISVVITAKIFETTAGKALKAKIIAGTIYFVIGFILFLIFIFALFSNFFATWPPHVDI